MDAYVPDNPAYVARATISGTDPLVYSINIPGDDISTAGRQGGTEGDVVTFKIGSRSVATGVWHSGTNVWLNIHPPAANAHGPYAGVVGESISFSGTALDWGTDIVAATYKWDWDNDGTYDETAQNPTHSWDLTETYTVGLKVADLQGGEGTTTAIVTINPAPSTVTVTCPASVIYTGLALTPCTAEATGVGMSPVDVTASLVYSSNTNAGSVTADASWAGDANHTGDTGSGSFTITPKPVTVTADPDQTKVYGEPDPVFTYFPSKSLSFTGALGRASGDDVGSYAINQGDLSAGGNYSIDFISADFMITKAPSTVTVTCPASETYTGSGLTPCTASYSGAGGLSGTLTPTYANNTVVGTATASATYVGDANHDGSSNSATFEITKAPSTVTVTCPVSETYTGSADPVHRFVLRCWWLERDIDPDLCRQHRCWDCDRQCDLYWRRQPRWQHQLGYLRDHQGSVHSDSDLPGKRDLHRHG